MGLNISISDEACGAIVTGIDLTKELSDQVLELESYIKGGDKIGKSILVSQLTFDSIIFIDLI